MAGDQIMEMMRNGLITALRLSLPLLVVSFAVGAVMGALQTLFQVQDSIIGQVPKMLAVLLTLGVCLPWMIELLSALFLQVYGTSLGRM
jgi:flagellar biosynthetic protein FliQ